MFDVKAVRVRHAEWNEASRLRWHVQRSDSSPSAQNDTYPRDMRWWFEQPDFLKLKAQGEARQSARDGGLHAALFDRVTHQCGVTIDNVSEFSVRQRDEQSRDDA